MWASSNSIQPPSSRALFPLHRVPVPCTSPAYVTDISKILIITTSIMCDVHMLWFCCWWLWWWCGDDDDAYCNANDDGCRMNNRVDPWKGRWARATKAWCSWTNGQTIILIISLVNGDHHVHCHNHPAWCSCINGHTIILIIHLWWTSPTYFSLFYHAFLFSTCIRRQNDPTYWF